MRVSGGISGLGSSRPPKPPKPPKGGGLDYTAQPGTPSVTTPPANTVTPPPGFNTPSGFNVVAVGPTGIPTLRSATAPASSSNQRLASKLIGR